jgi:hypothetical protein
MPQAELEKFRQKMGYEPLSSKDRKALLREYDAKIDFLIKLKQPQSLSPMVGAVLKVTHRYRNEAYHRDRIRKETLHSVVLVLFDLVTDLLETLRPGSMSYSSKDDWSEFCKRYRFAYPSDMFHDGLPIITQSLKNGMLPNMAGIRNSLADHLISRIEEMENALHFLATDSGARLSPAEELRRVQFWGEHGYVPSPDDRRFQSYAAAHSMETLNQWRSEADALREENDKLELFRRFAAQEGTLEPLEERINDAASSLDEAIQFAVDQARGK